MVFLALAPPSDYAPPHDRPGPATDTINFSAFDVDIASRELEAGAMDMYIFGLKIPAAQRLEDNADITVYQAPATMISVITNPAPAPDGELNPLSIKEVRQALQYIVNRPFISQEIYQGFAREMLTHVSPEDFDYLTVFETVRGAKIKYDPQLAKDIVTRAMTDAGAEMRDGFWHYNDQRIDLKFIVRTEDERFDIGNTLRADLEQLGFSIIPIPQQFGPAIFTVYGTDPQLFQWHLYTEGWGRGSPQRYDFSSINQMCAPWLGNMPGWQEVGFWQYEAPQIDEIGQRIFTGDFNGLEERNRLYAQATEACLDESVRLWVVTAVNNFPARADIQGVTEDLVSGPKSRWTLREAHVPGATDQLNVGNLWVWTNRTTWNPVGGFGDVYSADIWGNLQDSPLATHPFSGTPIAFRAGYEVETAGPGGKLTLPSDAFAWDADAGQWATVPAGTQATSKITYDYSKYFQSSWHHGRPITMADVIYPIAQLFDMVYSEDKAKIEFSIGTTNKPFTDTFRGFRITSDNKLEVYADFWHFENDYIAQFASVSGVSMPWEVLAAMDDLVFEQRKLAYSDTSAARFNVNWASLIQDGDARLVRNTLRGFAEDGFVPQDALTVGGQSLVSESEAVERYRSAIDWFAEKDHMIISNGPYQLETFDSAAQFAQITAFRDANYPFKPGDLYFGTSPVIQVSGIEGGALEDGTDFSVVVGLEGPGQLAVQYIFLDPATDEIVKSGSAEALGGNRFQVQMPASEVSALPGDLYHLYLAAYSDELASVLEHRLDIEYGAPPLQPQPTTPTGAPDATAASGATPAATAVAATETPDTDGGGGTSIGLIIGIILVAAAGIGVGLILIVMRSGRSRGAGPSA